VVTPESHETVAASEPVRVHHLLTHMSGLTYGFQYLHPVDEIYRNKGYDFGFAKDADLVQAVDDWCNESAALPTGDQVELLGRL